MYGLNKAEEAVSSHLGGVGEAIDKIANVVSGPLGMAEENLTTGKMVGEALGLGGSGGKKGTSSKGPTGAEVNAATGGESERREAEEDAEAAAKKYGISAKLLEADIEQESGYNAAAVSPTGAQGITQFEPATAKEYGVKYGTSPEDIESQIMGQAKLLAQEGARTDPKKALEAYEGGPGGVGGAEEGKYAESVLDKAGAGAVGGTPMAASSTGSPGSTSTEKAAEEAEKAEEKAKKAEEAATKAALDKEVEAQEKALGQYVSKALAEEGRVGIARRAAIAEEVAERKTFTSTMTSEEKAGRSEKEARDRATAQQEVANQEKGLAALTKLQTANQSHSLSTLNSELTKTNQVALQDLEGKLDATHKAELEKLSVELVKTWQEGEKEKVKLELAAQKEQWAATAASQHKLEEEAWGAQKKREEEASSAQVKREEEATNAQVASINKQATITKDQAESTAQGIADATKVALDKQAEVGLAGTAEISAHLQTVYDELTGNMDKAIGEAKVAQDETAGKGAIAEAEAAARTSRIEGEAKVREAEAQRQLELAKATASSASGSTTGINIESLEINAAGMSSSDILNEFAWSLKTGALPVAAPMPVPA
jgi:hypothetical protein